MAVGAVINLYRCLSHEALLALILFYNVITQRNRREQNVYISRASLLYLDLRFKNKLFLLVAQLNLHEKLKRGSLMQKQSFIQRRLLDFKKLRMCVLDDTREEPC